MKKAIIVDLDGTLADCSHRLHHIEGEKKGWDKFFEGIKDDKVNEWCKHLIYGMHTAQYSYTALPIIVTGRPEKTIPATDDWLKENLIWPTSFAGMFFRKDGDFRPDTVIKKEIYEKQIKGRYDILFVLEDRKNVVDMWRSLGLTCLQCADGDF